jgi:hypothetical protein
VPKARVSRMSQKIRTITIQLITMFVDCPIAKSTREITIRSKETPNRLLCRIVVVRGLNFFIASSGL